MKANTVIVYIINSKWNDDGIRVRYFAIVTFLRAQFEQKQYVATLTLSVEFAAIFGLRHAFPVVTRSVNAGILS